MKSIVVDQRNVGRTVRGQDAGAVENKSAAQPKKKLAQASLPSVAACRHSSGRPMMGAYLIFRVASMLRA